MKILFFASIAEATGTEQIDINGVATVSELKTLLQSKFPSLITMNYSVAVNQQISHINDQLSEQDEVALLPPFSGG